MRTTMETLEDILTFTVILGLAAFFIYNLVGYYPEALTGLEQLIKAGNK